MERKGEGQEACHRGGLKGKGRTGGMSQGRGRKGSEGSSGCRMGWHIHMHMHGGSQIPPFHMDTANRLGDGRDWLCTIMSIQHKERHSSIV